jgi:hypothetical protein
MYYRHYVPVIPVRPAILDCWIEHNSPPVQLTIVLRIATPDPSPLTLFPRWLGTEAASCQSNGSSVLQLSKIP